MKGLKKRISHKATIQWCHPKNTKPKKKMDTATGSSLMEEFELMKQAKYRVYMQNIDKALKNFEYSSEWADLISALGKLNKVISSYPQFQVIPRRIKISKRLSQCMHPALPSGVHLKALETYDVIFSNTGLERLASELFIYSAGLFPLLGYAAMNVRPILLEIYEKYFVPLGERLRPALSGFLSGVLPGLEAGVDHFERTNSLLSQVCKAVSPIYFYTCLWECVATNSSIRLPAITYVIDHFNKRIGMNEQTYLMGRNVELMMSGLCACLNDSVILVQRNTLEFLLLGFPLHSTILAQNDLIKLVTNSLSTILRRDMSLNRRVYSWLLGSEIQNTNRKKLDGEESASLSSDTSSLKSANVSYFEQNSKHILIKALRIALKNSIATADLRPYKILMSLLDKVEIGPVVVDYILIDVIRAVTLVENSIDVKKSLNALFGNFDPSFIWNFLTNQFESACLRKDTPRELRTLPENLSTRKANEVDSGAPTVIEICFLTESLLEILSLEIFNDTTRVFLPRVLFAITKIITLYANSLTDDEVTASILLSTKIIKHIQPMILESSSLIDNKTNEDEVEKEKNETNEKPETSSVTFQDQLVSCSLEKSKSDSKLNQSAHDEPMQRSRSNHNMSKKSPRKSKKSKSHSKLYELDNEIICVDSGQLKVGASNAISAPNLDEVNDGKKNRKRDKKMKRSTEDTTKNQQQQEDCMNSSKDSNETTQSEPILEITSEANVSSMKEMNEAQLQKYTILEKCSKQYEIFFQIYLSHRLLSISNSSQQQPSVTIKLTDGHQLESNKLNNINFFLNDELIENQSRENLSRIKDLFATLKIARTCRERKLQTLLNQSIGELDDDDNYDGDDVSNCDTKLHSNENLKLINKLSNLKLTLPMRRSIKFVSQLLVTFSTIPNYDQKLPTDYEEEELKLPSWIEVLSLVAAFSKSDRELQLNCISTLFELIDVVRSQRMEKLQPSGCQHLIMIPLLKYGHVLYMEQKTRIFQLLVSTLWDFLDFDVSPEIDLSQISILLYRLHSCLDSGLVERVISDRIENSHLIWSSSEVVDSDLENNDDRLSHYKLKRLEDLKVMLSLPEMSATNCSSQLTERQSTGFRKFELLWHLGRDQKECFDKVLLKMFDNLALPQHISMRTFIVKWLKEALLRGDLERLLMPLLKIMLNPNTKRISISNVHLLNKNGLARKLSNQPSVFDETKVADEGNKEIIVENEVYAIKFGDGSVRNHLESTKKKSPISSFPKKILNIATKGNSSSDKMREKGLMPSSSTTNSNLSTLPTSSETDVNNISLIVNPLEMQEESGYVSKSAPTSIRAEINKKFSVDSSSDYSTTTSADSMTDNEMSDDEKMKLSGRTEGLESEIKSKNKKSYEVEQHHVSYDESGTAADEYFSEKVLNEIERSVVHDLLENSLEGSDTSNDPVQKILAKRNSKTSLESAQKSDTASANTNRESTSEHEGEKQPKTISKHQQRKRKNLRIDKRALEKGKINVEILKKNLDEFEGFLQPKMEKLHPFHTHILLYSSNYDTKQILYSLETLRNLITAGHSKLFMCLTINTSVCETQLKHLLIRHRKSIFGKGFEGSLTNTEFNNAYRGVMYLEVLITVCLYYARSYFRTANIPDRRDLAHSDSDNNNRDEECLRSRANKEHPSSEDLMANCKIQLAAIEMLYLLFNELIQIVKDMGKGLANYVADLMLKCKVQKVILHCVLTSVHYSTTKIISTFSEKILKFNDPGRSDRKNNSNEKIHLEAIQIQLLKLLDAIIKLEHETIVQKGSEGGNREPQKAVASTITSILSQSPTRPKPISILTGNNIKYVHNLTISQQPMFLSAILSALQSEGLKHLHKNWTELVTSTLNCYSPDSLSHIVVSIMHQLCENIDNVTKIGAAHNSQVPSDYCISQLEALTVICHFCLLDNNQQVSLSHLFNPQNSSLSNQSSSYGQIYNNILNFFLSSSPLQVGEVYNKHQQQQNATRTCVLSHLPRIIGSMAVLWETELGQGRLVRQQLMEFITPIAMHYSCNFLAGISVVWHERAERKQSKNVFKFQQTANDSQVSLVKMVQNIKVMTFESLVQTLNSVIKAPPQIYRPPAGLELSISALEFFYVYMRSVKEENLSESWNSLINLIKDSISLSPPAQFMLFCILYELVKGCSPYDRKDKKDVRDLHDITTRLIEVISNIAGSCLEQTTWLRRNLAVKEEASDDLRDGGLTPMSGNSQYSVEAQSILAQILVNLLDYAFGSQEKDKITQIVTSLMYNVIPYLKNHTPKNISFFYACSHLLSTLTPYQYTRKAWRKDVFDLFLDTAFFQMDASCLPMWKQILDNLMSYDNITFRELMSRLSVAPAGSLNIFSSKEQEYEQKAMLLKKLAFVIFCSERDQYQKYMPEIQEQLSTCLRLPQVIPCVQAAVLLCFRVLLLRMSPENVTSLWPTIIAEMVQVFLSIEQELMTDTEEFRTQSSQHIRMMSALDTAWVTNTNNGLHAQNHPTWRMVQLETAKLLELGCVLPATNLPHFQMYRWAFVGSQHDYCSATADITVNGVDQENLPLSKFIPHVTRIAQLMDFRYTTHSPKNHAGLKSSHLVLTCQSIQTLQDLYSFFSTLCIRWPNSHHFTNANTDKDVKSILAEIEQVLSHDFLEKMPTSIVR